MICRRVKGQIVPPMDLMYCCTTSQVSVSPLTSCGGVGQKDERRDRRREGKKERDDRVYNEKEGGKDIK